MSAIHCLQYNAYKAISSGMYPPMAYVLASSLVHIPIALAETAIFSIVLYFMAGLVESASQWFYFYVSRAAERGETIASTLMSKCQPYQFCSR